MQSFTHDEVGHLAAGICHVKTGAFDLYCVNPPLVRTAAATAVVLLYPHLDVDAYEDYPGARLEFLVGKQFIRKYGVSSYRYLIIARWACIPFSIAGALVCACWASHLYGSRAGLLAAALWCTCPNIIGHGQLMTPDVAAAALTVLAAYTFWRWLQEPLPSRCVVAGVCLGLALLAKTTCAILLGVFPALLLAYRTPTGTTWKDRVQCALILVISVIVLNVGYGWEGFGRRLGTYRFVSELPTGQRPPAGEIVADGNRFTNTWLEGLPIPLPRNYLRGIDVQKLHVEREEWSYMLGEWRQGGWYVYYLYALLVKTPLGTLALCVIAIIQRLVASRQVGADELCLLILAGVFAAIVSSQTGVNRHLRYLFPAFPFVFVWISRVATWKHQRYGQLVRAVVVACITCTVVSSAWCLPHSLSYFNEAAGGPLKGPYHLAGSNTDWGQDLLFLCGWMRRHPEARPLFLVWSVASVDPIDLGVQLRPSHSIPGEGDDDSADASPAWLAISTNALFGRSGEYRYLLRRPPTDYAGYSVWIYQLPSLWGQPQATHAAHVEVQDQ